MCFEIMRNVGWAEATNCTILFDFILNEFNNAVD